MTFWVAGAVVAGGLGSALISSNAASKAASGAQNAANQANQTNWDMWNTTRNDQAPWREQGANAVNMLGQGFQPGGEFSHQFGMGDFQTDPGFQFRLDQGNQALARFGAANGRSLSGAQMKAASDYNQGMASQEYGNAYNRFMQNRTTRFGELSNLAGLGQSSVGQTGAIGTNVANQTGNNLMGAATVAGNAGMANAGAWGNALNNGINQWQNYTMMNNLMGSGSPGAYSYTGIPGSSSPNFGNNWGQPVPYAGG